MSDDAASVQSFLGRPPFPPVEIGSDGTWTHAGRTIDHGTILAWLKRHLRRDADGLYWIELPPVPVPVNVELAPFRVDSLRAEPRAELLLDDGTELPLADVELFTSDGVHRLFCRLEPAGHWAMFSRAAHQQAQPFIKEDAGRYYLEISGRRCPIESGGPEPARRHAHP